MKVEVGDLIQVNPEGKFAEHQGGFWAGRVLMVSEVKSWGCIAFCRLLDGEAFIRLEEEAYVKVGRLHWSNR